MEGSEPQQPKASIVVDDDEEKVELWLRLPDQLKSAQGFEAIVAEARGIVGAMETRERYRVSTRDGDFGPIFDLRKGLSMGVSLSLWQDGAMLRMKGAVSHRLHTAWGCVSLLLGAIAFVLVWLGFSMGMARHPLTARHAGKLGVIAGVVVTVLAAVILWGPVQLATKRGRQRSFEAAHTLIKDSARMLEAWFTELLAQSAGSR